MKQHRIIGLVLWFSERDGNGIILGIDRNEYYFDVSVTKLKNLKYGDRVTFIKNDRIKDCICARKVEV